MHLFIRTSTWLYNTASDMRSNFCATIRMEIT